MKNSIIKVSIIIPIYNSQKYLRRCLDSILVHQIKEIEVIMVDDGSTDASANICREYEQMDYRFVYCYQKKKGVSAARNRGISIAKGEYIAFVDSDDTVEKNMFEKMYCSAKDNNSDICICDYYRVIGSERLPVTDSLKGGLYLNDSINLLNPIFGMISDKGDIRCDNSDVWRRIFKRTFVTENRLMFSEDISHAEDTLFTIQATACAGSVYYLKDHRLYNHYYNPNSLCTRYDQRYIGERLDYFKMINDFLNNNNIILSRNALNCFYYRNIDNSFSHVALGFSENWAAYSCKEYRRIVNDEYVEKAVSEIPDRLNTYWKTMLNLTKNKKAHALYRFYKKKEKNTLKRRIKRFIRKLLIKMHVLPKRNY